MQSSCLLVLEKEDVRISICKSLKYNAIYIKWNGISNELENFMSKCPKCGSDDLFQRIPYFKATEKDWSDIESGKIGFLPGAYDRIGVPEPNWRCNRCGFEWHNLKDLI